MLFNLTSDGFHQQILQDWSLKCGDCSGGNIRPRVIFRLRHVQTRLRHDGQTTKNEVSNGQWMWLSWKSGCFQHQRYAVQIQSSAIFIYHQLNMKSIHLISTARIWTHNLFTTSFLSKPLDQAIRTYRNSFRYDSRHLGNPFARCHIRTRQTCC